MEEEVKQAASAPPENPSPITPQVIQKKIEFLDKIVGYIKGALELDKK